MDRRMTAFVTVFLLLITIFAGTGCVTTNSNNESTLSEDDAGNVTIIPLTESYSKNDSQSSVYAIIGDIIIVTLEENPTTGYSWNMSYSKGLELLNDSYVQDNSSVMMVGTGGVHQWTFEVIDNGTQSISGVYIRPWEEETGDEDSFSLDVTVLPEDEIITGTGTVTYLELEGGFYGIISADEQHYDPTNLAEDLQVDGTEVKFTAYPLNDAISFHMWGQIVELRSIEKISE